MTTPAPTPSPLRDDDLRDQHRRTLRRILCNAERRALTADEMRHLRRVTDAEQAESDGARADLATERAIAAADATVWTTAYDEEITVLKRRAVLAERALTRANARGKETLRRAEQAEAAIARVREQVAEWRTWAGTQHAIRDMLRALGDTPEPQPQDPAALDGTGDAGPEGDTCGGCGHHTTWHRDAGTRPCHKTGCDCAAFTEHGLQRCCVCGSPEVAERGYGTRRYCWPCALNAADPVETTTPVPEPEHRYLSTGCLHGHHAYCQGRTGQAGAKKPAACKFCGARCVCDCHTDAPAEPERRPNCRCRVTPLGLGIELDDTALAPVDPAARRGPCACGRQPDPGVCDGACGSGMRPGGHCRCACSGQGAEPEPQPQTWPVLDALVHDVFAAFRRAFLTPRDPS